MADVDADIVTVSHDHHDHNNISAVKGHPTVIRNAGFYEIGGVHMFAQKSHHDANMGADRGGNLIFKFRMDGVEICHMGDIGEDCSTMLVESMVPVNVLLIPVGGTYTIDAETAKDYVDKIMPDIVIPMHDRTKDCELDIDKVNQFLDLFDDDDIVYVEGNTVEFDRADFDGESTKVYVLEKF
jgi:L-ascorbate metabolism protein UlaG (beta-lactamase superfamily)